MVRRLGHANGALLVRTHGSQFGRCRMGRYQARTGVPWPDELRGHSQDCNTQLRLYLDDDQLLLYGSICARNAQTNQVNQLQGLRQYVMQPFLPSRGIADLSLAMFYNNLLTIPILLVLSLAVEDWSSVNVVKNFPVDTRNVLIGAMIFSGLSSIFISYTSAWCVRVTSSTTYSMVGALNKLPIAISGLVFFNAPVTIPSISAISIGFVSGIVYALAKLKQNSKPKTGLLPTTTSIPMSASSKSMRDSFKA